MTKKAEEYNSDIIDSLMDQVTEEDQMKTDIEMLQIALTASDQRVKYLKSIIKEINDKTHIHDKDIRDKVHAILIKI